MVTINPDLFVLNGKKEGEYVLYAPLAGSALIVNSSAISKLQRLQKGERIRFNKDIKEQLLKYRIIGEKFPTMAIASPVKDYKPTAVTLLPTWDCQLRCTYCYSHGGEDIRNDMTLNIAKSSIDFIIENALVEQTKKITIGFHGGGEPLLPKNLPLLDEILNYARLETEKYHLGLKTNAVTNAVMSEKTIAWVMKNLDSINISWDGLPDIQDTQRPLRNCKGSSKHVLHTMRILDENRFYYGIRATVTDKMVKRMTEIVDFVGLNTSAKILHLEQLYPCGRCIETGEIPPEEKIFIKEYLSAKEQAKKYGIELNNSCSNSSFIRDKFCGAAGSNFFVTPSGDVTTCLEVTRIDHPAKEIFFIGKYNKDKNIFEFNQEKIDRLNSRTIDHMSGCSNCFAKYSCSGDCIIKVFSATGSLYGSSDGGHRCETNRALIREDLYRKVYAVDAGVEK